MPARARHAVAAALCLALTGCFSLGRATPPVEQYVLGASRATATPNAAPGVRSLSIGLRRLTLASYLDTRLIIVRRGMHQVVSSDFRRWGEDLADGINRVLGAHLASEPPVGTVDVAPWPLRARHDYLVAVHVTRFEGVADAAATEGGVHVLAEWRLLRPEDGVMVARGRTDHREGQWTVGDFAELIVSLDSALSRVAADIRSCLGRVAPASADPVTCAPEGLRYH